MKNTMMKSITIVLSLIIFGFTSNAEEKSSKSVANSYIENSKLAPFSDASEGEAGGPEFCEECHYKKTPIREDSPVKDSLEVIRRGLSNDELCALRIKNQLELPSLPEQLSPIIEEAINDSNFEKMSSILRVLSDNRENELPCRRLVEEILFSPDEDGIFPMDYLGSSKDNQEDAIELVDLYLSLIDKVYSRSTKTNSFLRSGIFTQFWTDYENSDEKILHHYLAEYPNEFQNALCQGNRVYSGDSPISYLAFDESYFHGILDGVKAFNSKLPAGSKPVYIKLECK